MGVKDLDRRAASVTLSAGSLVAGALVELPAAWTIKKVLAKTQTGVLANKIRESVLAANLAGTALAMHPIHTRHAVDISVNVCDECLLQGTSYEAAVGTLEQWPGRRETSRSALECQKRCS